ncbi:MAG: hypothetical protein R3B09_15825 [Nannocystaceae bacterium]
MARSRHEGGRARTGAGAALLLALAGACGPGDEASGEAASGEAATEGSSSSTTDGEGTSAGTSSSTTISTTGTSEVSTSEGETTAPLIPDLGVPECGELTVCGQLCADLASDSSNCGACGISCVVPKADGLCQGGLCVMGTCEPGWGDCDGEVVNGCEEPLDEGMSCAQVCKPTYDEVCNLFDDNCDGSCDEGGIAGCRQPIHRASGALGHFYTVDLNEAMSGGYNLESANYFHLYIAAIPGVAPFYRCLKGNGKRFYTRSADCEGAGPVEGILGHIANEKICGSTELYRLYSSGSGDHFYTVSASERDNAVSMYGYKYESVAGYVWLGP